MRKTKVRIKEFLIVAGSVVLGVLILEATSASVMWATNKINNENVVLIKRFPSQIRLSLETLQIVAKSKTKRTTESMDFNYDPMLGILNKNYLTLHTKNEVIAYNGDRWWSEISEKYKTKKWIVALGGSTTASSQKTNWPAHLIDSLEKHGINGDELVVLNAGHNGYSLSQEFLFFAYRIYPNLISNGVRLNTLISLDGVNDVSFNLAPEIDGKLRGIGYSPMYNGFMNILEKNFSGQFKGYHGQEIAGLISYYANLLAVKVVPITMALINNSGNTELPSELMVGLGSYKNFNLMRFGDVFIGIPQSLGAIDTSDLYNLPKGVVYEERFDGLLDEIDLTVKDGHGSKDRNSVIKNSKNTSRDFSNIKYVKIGQESKASVKQSVGLHLQNFDNFARGGNIKNYHFLQPIVLSNTINVEKKPRDIPSFDYILVHWAMRGSALGLPIAFDSKDMYAQLRALYQAGNKFDLSGAFENAMRAGNNVMTNDNIHYTATGSRLLSDRIAEYCLSRDGCGLNN